MTRFHFPRLAELPRVSLAHLPTPLEDLRLLSAHLRGPRILIKRDDQTGLALGGNKTRKLEFLLADALAQGADTIITAGAAQSNHCRQTAAAARRSGLACHLVLGGAPGENPQGNLFLDHLLGATIHWTPMERRIERLGELEQELALSGNRPYRIPYGGSNEVGAAGYAVAVPELAEQLSARDASPDRIVIASSSGGTQAGLAVGMRAAGLSAELLGISIDKGERDPVPYEEQLAELANATALRLGSPGGFVPGDFRLRYDFLGKGYGVVGDLEREAIRLLARTEALLLDPVYTGRAMGALLALIRSGEIDRGETVLFWHTGGAPALFAYTGDLQLGNDAER
jgi:D-cysteine desulfhydrase family pyridoxal phosphate-dependent enzyme